MKRRKFRLDAGTYHVNVPAGKKDGTLFLICLMMTEKGTNATGWEELNCPTGKIQAMKIGITLFLIFKCLKSIKNQLKCSKQTGTDYLS
jgi:hypothetical protein